MSGSSKKTHTKNAAVYENTKFDTKFLAEATPVHNVRADELALLQEAHVVAKGREIAANVIREEPSSRPRASFSDEGRGRERASSDAPAVSRSSFSENRSGAPERRGSADFVMLHSGSSPTSSPTSVSADLPTKSSSHAEHEVSVLVELDVRSQEVRAKGTTTLGEFRQLVAAAFSLSNLRLASPEGPLDHEQDHRTLDELGLVSNARVLASVE